MTLDEIKQLVSAGESETLEFKATTGQRGPAAKTVCAMLNTRGGYVLFGVKPDGTIAGQKVGGQTLDDVSAEIRNIDPLFAPTINRVRVALGKEVISLRVDTEKGGEQPYRYGGRAYCRIGSTTREMSTSEYNHMLLEQAHSETRWENQSADGWTIDDLDEEEISRTVEEAIRRGRLTDPGSWNPTALLRGLGLIRKDGVLFRAAAVLFGKSDQLESEMPQCFLRVARFRGINRDQFLDNRQFHGNAFSLLQNAERFLRDTLPIAGRFEAKRFDRIDDPLYPPLATREALANALCHRDYAAGMGAIGLAAYDDRLEITSPGRLPFGLTPQMLLEAPESKPRNLLIASTFYRRGIIESWGLGIGKIMRLTKEAGLPLPEIENAGEHVTVCFRHGRSIMTWADADRAVEQQGVLLSQRQQMILSKLNQADHPLSLREVNTLIPRIGKSRLQRDLATLRKLNLVELIGYGRGASWASRDAPKQKKQ